MNSSLRENSGQLFELGPRIGRMIRQSMKGLGPTLTLPQYRILSRVAGGMGKASVLCAIQGVSLPAMSRMVDILTRKGLLKRSSNAKDRRQIVLSLSREGQKIHDQIKHAILEQFTERLSSLSQAQQRSVASALDLLESIFP